MDRFGGRAGQTPATPDVWKSKQPVLLQRKRHWDSPSLSGEIAAVDADVRGAASSVQRAGVERRRPGRFGCWSSGSNCPIGLAGHRPTLSCAACVVLSQGPECSPASCPLRARLGPIPLRISRHPSCLSFALPSSLSRRNCHRGGANSEWKTQNRLAPALKISGMTQWTHSGR